MSAVDAATADRQRRASNPRASAWVSANAGSGKTYVLVQRVKRLLLDGAEPSRILCLTFTKAAAANMSNRLLRDLGAWVVMDEGGLRAELATLDGEADPAAVSPKRVDAARRVFAGTLETPGGLKIQTIHGFCDGLLHQFPFEAGVAASFLVLDDVGRGELLDRARADVALAARGDPHGPLGVAVSRLAAEIDLTVKDDVLTKMLGHGDALVRMLLADPDGAGLDARLRAAFAVDAGLSMDATWSLVVDEAVIAPARWPALIAAWMADGGATMVTRARELELAVAMSGLARARAYDAVFRKKDGDFLQPASLATKPFIKANSELAALLDAERERLIELDARRRAVAAVERSHALAFVAAHVANRFEAAKVSRALLDYDDLVGKAAALLTGPRGPWVRWKLDRGIDHILVDEAQDTSRAQWDVARALSEEFFAGEGSAPRHRTLFAVGDEKQSIFSFQGAEPRLFREERARVARAAAGAGARFEDVRLTLSFRSVPAVLQAVDAVFARAEAAEGVTADGDFPPHHSRRAGVPGRVEVWPVEPAVKTDPVEGWEHPFAESEDAAHPNVVLAERLAAYLAAAIERDAVHDRGGPRPLRAGDVLILVRKRGKLFEAILRAAKNAGLPIAGADRLVLVEHIAVMDLMALGDVLLLPEDDLSLAAVLKSPLFGLDEQDLYDLAQGRPGSLIAALRDKAATRPVFATALARLEAWAPLARGARPFEFYARVLGADGGRRAFQERLGREATDAIDEFLARALAHESGRAPTLQGFLAELRAARIEVKREFDDARDEVRVMTAHAAKGLEAKLVVLPDTTGLPDASKVGPIFDVGSPDAPLFAWSGGAKTDAGPLVAARARALALERAEYRRLLYVSLTRAEERLIVAGAPVKANTDSRDPGCWYELVRAGLEPGGRMESVEGVDGDVLVSAGSAPVPPARALGAVARGSETRADFAWLDRPAPPPPVSARAITPARRRLAPGAEPAATRGAALHRLLQLLPEIPPERRAERALGIARRLAPEIAEAVAAEALAVVALPAFAPFLSPDAVAEVPIAGVLADDADTPVTGRIDRLVVTAAEILLLDYKTGAAPPPGVVPPDTARQLALYADLLARTFPGRPVAAYVLWTGVPRLDRVADHVLAEARASVMAAIP